MTTTIDFQITDEHKRQFRDDGFFVLDRVVPEEHLQLLRDICAKSIAAKDAELQRAGTGSNGITHIGKRYFISNAPEAHPEIRRFLFSDYMAEICKATIGNTAYLFWEQYVVKGAEVGMKFDWHQDSGYVGHQHTPYLSCWVALDDMTEANGTVYMLPYSRAGGNDLKEHRRLEGSNDKVGYFGDDPGVPVICPAGSIAVFSSRTFHRSGTNTTKQMRRVYLAQYSPDIIMTADNSAPWGRSELFVKDGRLVEKS